MRPRETLPKGETEISEINGYYIALVNLKVLNMAPQKQYYIKQVNTAKYWRPTTYDYILKHIFTK